MASDRDAWLIPGRNCRELAHADRVGVLIDADAFFCAVHQALVNARHNVFILAWDIDSRVRLVRNPEAALPWPATLAALLHELASERPALRIHVLVWDYAAIYLFEREPLQRLRFAKETHPRVRFELDDRHPTGGSQHEKIIVIDDRVAFCGGLDVCDVRWDTRDHLADDPRRKSRLGRRYPPHHDVQAIVDGAAAAALGVIARERWQRMTGEAIPVLIDDHDPWPKSAPVDLIDVDVAIARTRHGREQNGRVREIERLWLDTIAAAERLVYIETPYLTSRAVAEAIARRLQEPDPPEVIVMMPQRLEGWFENATLGYAAERVISQLQTIDHRHRLHVFCPVATQGGSSPVCVNVHSKLAIIDDRLLRIGSANLTERSMRLDTECDLAIEARGSKTMAAVAAIRHRLLAEHVRAPVHQVRAAIGAAGHVAPALTHLAERTGALLPYAAKAARTRDRILLDVQLVDSGRPLTVGQLGKVLVRGSDVRATWWRRATLIWWAFAIAFGIIASAAGLIDVATASEWLIQIGTTRPWAAIVVAALFVAGGMVFVPVTLMIVQCGLLFGPWLGTAYALTGALCSAAAYWWLGRRVGGDIVHRVAGPRLRAATETVARRGLLAVVAVRVIPIAPHFVVGLAAGASRIGFRDYMLGTGIAITPGGIVLVLLGHAIGRGAASHSPAALGVVLGLAVAVLVVGWLLQRMIGEREPSRSTNRKPEDARAG